MVQGRQPESAWKTATRGVRLVEHGKTNPQTGRGPAPRALPPRPAASRGGARPHDSSSRTTSPPGRGRSGTGKPKPRVFFLPPAGGRDVGASATTGWERPDGPGRRP